MSTHKTAGKTYNSQTLDNDPNFFSGSVFLRSSKAPTHKKNKKTLSFIITFNTSYLISYNIIIILITQVFSHDN